MKMVSKLIQEAVCGLLAEEREIKIYIFWKRWGQHNKTDDIRHRNDVLCKHVVREHFARINEKSSWMLWSAMKQ